MDGPIPLDARKQQILRAVVADYTQSAVPVGSQALAAHLAAWSSATIRNDLASLVDIGYLLQPHTSAGRVPSDRGYRYYVDFLMKEEAVPVTVRRQMEPYFADIAPALEELLDSVAAALAQVVDGVAILTAPQSLGARVKHLDLVCLDARHALMVLVLQGNLIRQHLFQLEADSTQDELTRLAAELNAQLSGQRAEEVAGVSVPARAPEARAVVMREILQLMRGIDARQDTLIVHDGVRNLLHQPEFGDISRLQQVLEVVEEERMLRQMLASLEIDQGMRIMIGTENGLEQLRGCSLVITSYDAGQGRTGTIGVLGPTRMRYSQVAPRVRYAAQRLGDAVGRLLG
jgi:heat-inducible transcriptional repressor